jgi:hypothetical protein
MPKTAATSTTPLPYSWGFHNWPPGVFPYTGSKARHVVKQYGDELRAAGALTRPLKQIVILGAGYAMWLASKAPRVAGYDIAPNAAQHAHKRRGAHRAKAGPTA